MDELAKKRADKKQDCREWTAIDALEDLLADLKSGSKKADQLAVHYAYDRGDGGMRQSYCCAGMTRAQHIALLYVNLHVMTQDYIE